MEGLQALLKTVEPTFIESTLTERVPKPIKKE